MIAEKFMGGSDHNEVGPSRKHIIEWIEAALSASIGVS
jgi:hypothetical protein